jgi:hypothetical protein
MRLSRIKTGIETKHSACAEERPFMWRYHVFLRLQPADFIDTYSNNKIDTEWLDLIDGIPSGYTELTGDKNTDLGV